MGRGETEKETGRRRSWRGSLRERRKMKRALWQKEDTWREGEEEMGERERERT